MPPDRDRPDARERTPVPDGITAHTPEGVWFETSGSSGAPKRIFRSQRALDRECEGLAGLVRSELRGRRRIVGLVPDRHIYGHLWVRRLSAALDLPVLDLWRADAATVRAAFRPGDLVIGFPFLWAAVAHQPGPQTPDVCGVTSTGPMAPQVFTDLISSVLSALVEVFGSTETGGIGWRSTQDDGFRLLPHLARGGDGQAVLFDGQPLPLQDHLVWEDDRFRPLGRADGMVQVAGQNISLAAIQQRLEALPDVSAARVRLFDAAPGQARVKAFIVPAGADDTHDGPAIAGGAKGWADMEARLRRWAASSLTHAERPLQYRFGTVPPRTEMGKDGDW